MWSRPRRLAAWRSTACSDSVCAALLGWSRSIGVDEVRTLGRHVRCCARLWCARWRNGQATIASQSSKSLWTGARLMLWRCAAVSREPTNNDMQFTSLSCHARQRTLLRRSRHTVSSLPQARRNCCVLHKAFVVVARPYTRTTAATARHLSVYVVLQLALRAGLSIQK